MRSAVLGDLYMRECRAFVFVFDPSVRESFAKVVELVEKVYRVKDVETIFGVLLATKCDTNARREVEMAEAETLANDNKMPFFVVSAKTGEGVERAFKIAAAMGAVDRTSKVGVFGGPAVGKTALVLRFVQDVFIEEYDPTIENSYRYIILYLSY